MTAPLSHIRVLDLSRILAGPWTAQHLADMGAEVIKIERPGTGDDTRSWGPPFAVAATSESPAISAYFSCANRGKKSCAVDITRPEGQELVRKLAVKSDVVIENFKVGGLKKYALDYESLKAVNPRIIYCSITGFGQTGPYAARAGYDFLLQGMGGLMSVTGEPEDKGGQPVKVGVAISDQFTGMNALAGILSCLIKRDRTGEGDYIDVSLLDSTIAGLVNQAATYHITGQSPQRLGNAHPTIVPYQVFETADGYIILAVGNDGQFVRFCEVAGLEHLAEDEKYATNPQRIVHRDSLIAQLIAPLKTKTSIEWITQLEAAAVPCGPINTIEQVFADPHVQHRQMQRHLPQHDLGAFPVTANPIRLQHHDTTSRLPPPHLGAHTLEILSRVLQFDDQQIAHLCQAGIIEMR